MSNVYFTADLHLGHAKVAEKRGFTSIGAHDTQVVDSLRETVQRRDLLWVLGDIAFTPQALAPLEGVLCRMNAILGNHDKLETTTYLRCFHWLGGAVRYKNMWLTHMPIHPQEIFQCRANVHGHIHKFGKTESLGYPYINVNWDFWKKPVSLNDIILLLAIRRPDPEKEDDDTD